MRLIKNFAYLSGAEGASKLVTFAAIAYLARVVGPVGFGYVEFAGAVMLCAGLIVDQGFGPYGAREIAKAPQRTAEFFSEIVLARFVLAAIAFGALLVFALSLGRSSVVTQLLIIYGLSLWGMPLLLQWVFQGHDQMQTVAAIQLLRQTVYAVVVFAFVRSQAQISFAGVAEVAGVTCAGIFGLWIYRRRFRESLQVRAGVSKQLFREGVPIGLSQLFWMARMYGATVILGLIASPPDVGFFGAAMRILVSLHAFIYLYYFNLLPTFSRAWQQGEAKLSAMIEQSLRRVTWVSILAGIAWVILAPRVIVGVYGSAFAPAGAALQWLAGVAVIAALSGHYRFGLIAAGRQGAEMVAQAIGTALAVVLLPLGYAQGGPAGSALSLVVAELVVWLGAWWWCRKKLGFSNHMKVIARPLAGGAVATCLLLLMPASSLGIQIMATVLVIGTSALVFDRSVREQLRRFAASFRHWLKEQMQKRAPEVVRW
jgi:PST family polysaccharide transporter